PTGRLGFDVGPFEVLAGSPSLGSPAGSGGASLNPCTEALAAGSSGLVHACRFRPVRGVGGRNTTERGPKPPPQGSAARGGGVMGDADFPAPAWRSRRPWPAPPARPPSAPSGPP